MIPHRAIFLFLSPPTDLKWKSCRLGLPFVLPDWAPEALKRIDVRPLRALIRPFKAVLGLATGCARLMRPKEAESMHERTDGLERADSRAEFMSERANLRPDEAD